MPKLVHKHPSYRLHRPSGQAIVSLNGRTHYLGALDTPESQVKYHRLIGESLAGGKRLPELGTTGATVQDGSGPCYRARASDLTVVELIDAFWSHAQSHYAKVDGSPPGNSTTSATRCARSRRCSPTCLSATSARWPSRRSAQR